MSASGPTLRRILLMVRSVEQSRQFYVEALGMHPGKESDGYAEIKSADGSVFALQETYNEPLLSTGYTPLFHMDVQNLDHAVPKLVMAGAHLDGAIQHTVHGKVASVRTPDGHVFGLYERDTNTPDVAELLDQGVQEQDLK
eukprot:Clim_evm1s180 gene=Clim_evmTU1s180